MTHPVQKPRLSPAASKVFYAIVAYARKYRRSYLRDPRGLTHAASDVMDGWIWRGDPEERELMRAGVIERVKDEGQTTTWLLTAYGCWAVSGGRVDLRTEPPRSRH